MSVATKLDDIFRDLILDSAPKGSSVYLKYKDQEFGPILPEELYDYVQFLKDEKIYFKTTDTEKESQSWQALIKHPYFQRRKPENINKDHLPENYQGYILKNGIKKGPFNHEQICSSLKELDLLTTDFLSIDNGKNWKKIFEYSDFDRRMYSHDQLPFTHKGKAPITIKNEMIHKGTEEEIAKVAFQEHHSQEDKSNKDLSYSNSETNSTYLHYYITVGVLVIFLAMFYSFNSKIKIVKTKKHINKNVRSFKPENKIRNTNRSNTQKLKVSKTETLKQNRQKSILNSKTFKNRFKLGQNDKNDTIDDSQPFEQDIVRKMASKEILYPEDFAEMEDVQDVPEEDDWVKRLEEESIKKRNEAKNSELYYETEEVIENP